MVKSGTGILLANEKVAYCVRVYSKEDATVEGNGDGNGEVPPGQTEDADGNI